MPALYHITTTVLVDLETTPFADWPRECQERASSYLSNAVAAKRFCEQLPAMRHSWLAVRVAQIVNINLDHL